MSTFSDIEELLTETWRATSLRAPVDLGGVAIDASDPIVKIRRKMEQEFGKRPHAPHDSQRILVRARDLPIQLRQRRLRRRIARWHKAD